MKALVTVGTYKFDPLIETIDKATKQFPDINFTCQIGTGQYIPEHCSYFTFEPNLDFAEYDLIITHAGAGNVYRLLEMQKKLIVVPNLLRVDHHQKEIAQFVAENQYALSCENVADLAALLTKISSYTPSPYTKEPFFKSQEMSDYLEL